MLIGIKKKKKVYQVCQINQKMTVHVAQGEKKKKRKKEKENLKEHAATMIDTQLLSQQKKK